MKLKVGNAPLICKEVVLKASEMMFVIYLPVVMPGSDLRLPKNLEWCAELFKYIDYGIHDYVYISAKSMFVGPECRGRAGWHLDGFGTDDINYVWSDCHPTEFCIQDIQVTNDCVLSMQELEQQVCVDNIITYPNNTLLRMDNTVVHRVSISQEFGIRTFVKISVSSSKYDLAGNAHNYLFDYGWDLSERNLERNHPTYK